MLALMSPFRCIGDVVETMVGKFGRMFVANRFPNIEWIEKVDSPVWIVHG